jgi:hypothetical protein
MARPEAKSHSKPAPSTKKVAKAGATPRRRGNSGSAFITLTVIAVTGLALVALPLCILVVAGTLPTVVAVLVDRHKGRYLARTVGAMNIAGVVPGALRMWAAGMTFASLQQVISSPYTWLIMYGAAAVGWLLYFGTPPLTAMVVEIKVDDTKRRLEEKAKALVEEWGEEVTGGRS